MTQIYGGIPTLEQTRAVNNQIQGNIDFNTYKAVAMSCDSGSTLPTSPATGQWFLHTPTGRQILMQYNGTAWKPLASIGTTVIYIDGTNGSDIQNGGYATGANAYKTITYAWSQLPPLITDDVTINLSADTYREQVTLSGKWFDGDHTINIIGATTTLDTGIPGIGTSNPIGNGVAGYGVLIDNTKSWVANAYLDQMIEITGGLGAGQIRVIHVNTASSIGIVGRWETVPDATSTYRIYSIATRITGANAGAETTRVRSNCITVNNGQYNIVLKNLKIDYAGLSTWDACFIIEDAHSHCISCWLEGGFYWSVFVANGGSTHFDSCVFKSAGIGDIRCHSEVHRVLRCRLTSSNNRALDASNGGLIRQVMETYIGSVIGNGIIAGTQGTVEIEAYTEVDSSSGDNIYVTENASVFHNAQFGALATHVSRSSGGWGSRAVYSGMVSSASAITYILNTSGTYTPATQLAGQST